MIGSNLQKKMINRRLPVVNLLITFLLPKIMEKKTFNVYVSFFLPIQRFLVVWL